MVQVFALWDQCDFSIIFIFDELMLDVGEDITALDINPRAMIKGERWSKEELFNVLTGKSKYSILLRM